MLFIPGYVDDTASRQFVLFYKDVDRHAVTTFVCEACCIHLLTGCLQVLEQS